MKGKKGLMDILIKKKGRVKDEGIGKGKPSIAEVIGMKRKKSKCKSCGGKGCSKCSGKKGY